MNCGPSVHYRERRVGIKREVQQWKNIAEAARKVGAEHFVYSSVDGAERNTGITRWETKEVEKHLRNLKLPMTVVRPVSFMETYQILEVEVGLLKGKLADPIRGDNPYRTIATDDIGAFVVLAFDHPKGSGAKRARDRSLRSVPSRPLISLNVWAGRLVAICFTATGWCFAVLCNNRGGRPLFPRGWAGKGCLPGSQTVIELCTPTT